MSTLRRVLKYTPAMVIGLLIVAWAASIFFPFGLKVRWADGMGHYRLMFAMSEVGLQSTNSLIGRRNSFGTAGRGRSKTVS
jgi:hypothetical protein